MEDLTPTSAKLFLERGAVVVKVCAAAAVPDAADASDHDDPDADAAVQNVDANDSTPIDAPSVHG